VVLKNNNISEKDLQYLRLSLRLAERSLGTTCPNPSVGCVIVKGDELISLGQTQKGGRPHAEQIALKMAGPRSKGATAYVSLEPCAHKGKTPSCAELIIKADISRVVSTIEDPDLRVSGKGFQMLKDSGLNVNYGFLKKEALEVNSGFFSTIEKKRPLTILKLATTIDGKLGMLSGNSKWITSNYSRNYVHILRSSMDAVLIGKNTLLRDDPNLTCRIRGLEHKSPIRVVLDTKLSLNTNFNIFKTAKKVPTWIITTNTSKSKKIFLLKKLQVKIIFAKKNSSGQVDIDDALQKLAANGVTRLLIEGGAIVASNFIKSNLVDKLYCFRAPRIIGSKGLSSFSSLSINSLSKTPYYKSTVSRNIHEDSFEIYEKEK